MTSPTSHVVSLYTDERSLVDAALGPPSMSALTRVVECFRRGRVLRETLRKHVGRPVYCDCEFEGLSRGVQEEIRSLGPQDTVLILRRRGTIEESGRREAEQGKVAAYLQEQTKTGMNLPKASEDAGNVAEIARGCLLRQQPLAPRGIRNFMGGNGSLNLH